MKGYIKSITCRHNITLLATTPATNRVGAQIEGDQTQEAYPGSVADKPPTS